MSPGEALLVGLPDGEQWITEADAPVLLGRDPLCPLVVDDPLVSREHLEIGYHDGRWRLRDLGSSNGTYSVGEKIDTVDVVSPCAVRLGDSHHGPLVLLRPAPDPAPGPVSGQAGPRPDPRAVEYLSTHRSPRATHRIPDHVTLGRAPDNTVVLDDLMVSRCHAQLVRSDAGVTLTDLGSSNGTFVNGRRITSAALRRGDLVSIGHHQMVFDGEQVRRYVDDGRVSLSAESLTVRVGKGRVLLDDVSFALGECSLLAVVGPSGAGKSTLLGAMTGIRPATSGSVRYEGRDLYGEYDELRHRVGLVPQDDILHSQLTVRRALRYAAALRFGPDVTTAERDTRIDEVLDQLALADHADQRVDTLSGGQRKRTSVALELLTEPSLLFLDEPTSGLDPALDRDVMVCLRGLADRGRTVVVVTHSPLHLGVCDRVLVLARGGKVAYLGPPDQLLSFFGAREYADVFNAVATDPRTWAARYAKTAPPASAGHGAGTPASASASASAAAPPSRQGRVRQLAVLTRRMVAVTLADRLYAALSLGLPLGLALLLHVVPGSDGLGRPQGPVGRSAEATQLLVVLIIGAVFIGLAGGIREFVKEGAVYRRERAVGLSPSAYVGSKLLVFAALTAVQSALFVLAGLAGRPSARQALVLGDPTVELIVVVWLTAVTSAMVGLLVSAFVSTAEQTMPVLVGLVMTQLVLCGGLFGVVGRHPIEELSWLAPARWGYAAAATTVDLRSIMAKPSADALWNHTTHAWGTAMGIVAVQALAATVAVRFALRRHEPGRT